MGAIIRSQVGAIIGLLAWGFVAENLIFGFLPGLGRFGPFMHRTRWSSSRPSIF